MSISSLFSENDYDIHVRRLFARDVTVTGTVRVSRIDIDSASIGALTALSETQVPVERSPISNLDCWIDLLAIPESPPAKTPWPGTASGVVSGISGVPLGSNPSSPLEFGYIWSSGPAPPYDKFSQMVPAGTSAYAYTPTLKDSLGAVIPYDPNVWVADGLRQIVSFISDSPESLGFTPPLTIDYWQYTGDVAGAFKPVNEGSGAEVFDETTANTFRTIVGSEADGIRVTQDATEISIDCTLVGLNAMADSPTVGNLYKTKTASAELEFRSLVAGSGVALSQDGTSVTISSTGGGGGLAGVTNDGAGAGVYETLMGSTAVLRSLLGTANGLSVTETGSTITIDNTLTGVNLGTGIGVWSAKSGSSLQFNSLAGSGIISVAAPVAGVIVISSSGVAALANEGSGAQVFDSATSGTLRSITHGAGISVTQSATEINLVNTAPDQTVALATTGTGMAVTGAYPSFTLQNTAPDQTVALATTGTGMAVTGAYPSFTLQNTAPDQTVVLSAGSGITITGTYPNFTITATGGAAMPTLVDTQVLTANGNWTSAAPLAAGATSCTVVLCGGGGGGGSGTVAAGSTSPNGGGGGGPGGITIVESIPIATFSASQAFVAGTGGAGGSGSNVAGSDGGQSTFSVFAAPGGSGGSSSATLTGDLSKSTYLAGEVLSAVLIEAYQVNTRSGSAVAAPVDSVADPPFPIPGFGGSGGNLYNGGGNVSAGKASSVHCASLSGAAATTAGGSGAGTAASTASNTYYGAGGGGGGASAAGNGGAGGAGYRGSGGGGGGAATTGHTSGAGGAGGAGWLIVYSYA